MVLICSAPAQAQSSNNDCTGATVIPSTAPTPVFTDLVDTTSNTSDGSSLSCNGSGAQTDGNTAWYTWTPGADVAVNISTAGSTGPFGALDTAHGVFTGSCAALIEVACVDIGLTDDLFFEATGGVTYFIKFGEFLDGVGGGDLMVTLEPPPPPEQFVLESTRDGLSPPISTLAGVTPGLGAQPGASGKNIEMLQIFDGIWNEDNAFTNGGLFAPPDTVGDVGISHYVQMSNIVTTIFDKSGSVVLGPMNNNVFWTGLGGACQDFNRGDPLVLYDEQTDRWLVSQFAFPNGPGDFLCIALSTSGDPTGTYYQHEFDFSAIGFPDYPKYGFVTDAISVMVNLFNPFQGAGLGVIDKGEAFSAGQTTMVFFTVGTSEFGFLPGDNDGPVFDNTPPTFFTNNGGSGDRIDVWEIDPDFAIPTDSTIAEVAQIPVTPWDSVLCNAPRGRCIDQPGSGTGVAPDAPFPNNITFLEGITDRLMHRLQIRDFGKRKEAVVVHTVDADGNGTAGVRWYEFRNKDGDSDGDSDSDSDSDKGWTLKKGNTFSPDGDHRWMGSIAKTREGETRVGYSISSQTTHPSIGLAGRTGGSGHLNAGELVAFDGNLAGNVQTRTARWGDYSAVSIDPVDDTCWYTTEYAKPNRFIGEQFGWATKIVQFDVDDDSDSDSDSDSD